MTRLQKVLNAINACDPGIDWAFVILAAMALAFAVLGLIAQALRS